MSPSGSPTPPEPRPELVQPFPVHWAAKPLAPITTRPLSPQILPGLAFSEGCSVISGQKRWVRQDTYPQGFWTKEGLACLSGEVCRSRCPESGSAWVGRHRWAFTRGLRSPRNQSRDTSILSSVTVLLRLVSPELPALLGQLLK